MSFGFRPGAWPEYTRFYTLPASTHAHMAQPVSVGGSSVALMKPITWDSTREEVLAAADEHGRRADAVVSYTDDEIDWRGDPPERREGCYWSKDGRMRVHVGSPRDVDPLLARQQVAGEEDQNLPGWDDCP